MNKKSLLLVIAILTISFSIKAQQFYIGPQAGWQKAPDASVGKFIIGGIFRAKFNNLLGAEASVNYRKEFYSADNITVSSFPVMVNAMVFPLSLIPGIIQPLNYIYGVIGAGWYYTQFNYSPWFLSHGFANNSKNKFGVQYGAGIEVPISGSGYAPSSMFTADFRYVSLKYDSSEFPGVSNLRSNFVAVTAGFLVRF